MEDDHTAKFAAANSSWAEIQSFTEAVNYDTQAYRDRVTVSNAFHILKCEITSLSGATVSFSYCAF